MPDQPSPSGTASLSPSGAAPISAQERLDRLRLARSDGIGPVTGRDLLARFGSATAALAALPDLARKAGRNPIRACPPAKAAAEMTALDKLGARLLVIGDSDYPVALAAIEDAPLAITVKGRLDLLARPQIALVGARNASANGRKIAQDMARELTGAGCVVVSGLARGIDSAAHLGALQAQDQAPDCAGGTIAVIAGGIDVLYPPENGPLFERIGQDGLVIAELAPGTEPLARHFPRRNRIIAGLSAAVVVIEAALKSGSLITARLALEQGREVMAVPGSPLDPRCRGTNHLIREGALLVEEASQVLEAIGPGFRTPPSRPMAPGGNTVNISMTPPKAPLTMPQAVENTDESEEERARRAVLSQLGPSPVGVDELRRQCQCSGPVLGMVLLELDLAGRLERHPGNRVSLIA
ncbi:MAG TPA: DNA-processing protein DprA [Dongiaceae bacterium]|nr:DNA-processing protein DprA [Dongiaceae bacterium]